VATARSTGVVGNGVFGLMTRALAGAAVALGLGIVLGLILIHRPAQALERIAAGLRRLAADDIPSNVPVTTSGDVGALGDTFNRTLGWLRQRLGDYRALSRVEDAVSTAISGDRSVPEILTSVLRQVVTGMEGDVGIAFLREEQGLVARGVVGLWGVPADGLVVRGSGRFTWSVLASRAGAHVVDTEADGRADEPHVVAAGLRSVIAAPMLCRDEAIGVVEVGYRTPRSFAATDGKRLEVMTRRLVQAVEQVRALEEAPELPARLAILRRRAALEGIVLDDDVALLIAREVPGSIRELEGTFTRLLAFADLTEGELSLGLVREFFERTRVAERRGGAEPAGAGRPAPFLAIVRRGATDLFESLKASLEKPGVVEVMWDRRVGQRRRRDQQRVRDRRRGDRRRAASIAQVGQDYMLVRRLA
jgi:GAF domain-containing protein